MEACNQALRCSNARTLFIATAFLFLSLAGRPMARPLPSQGAEDPDSPRVPSPVDRVTDLAEVFTEERARALIDRLAAYEQETSHQIAVLTISDLAGETIEAFSLRVARTWGVGQRGIDNGVLVTVSVKDRRARIEVGLGLEEAITDSVAAEILDEHMIPAFKRGELQSGIEVGIGKLMEAARKLVIPASDRPASHGRGPSERPAGHVFTDLMVADAAARAKTEGKLLLIDGTAVWCPPCQQMEHTTWVDERVLTWVEEHAIAVQLDVDRNPSRAAELGIRAMPTIIALRDGAEHGRLVGYQDADALLDWLERMVTSPQGDLPPKTYDFDLTQDENRDPGPMARKTRAGNLFRNDQFAEALEEYLWLWNESLRHDPRFRGVRRSFMASDIRKLVEKHEPARHAFLAILDQTETIVWSGKGGEQDWEDFRTLTVRILDEEDRLLELYVEWRDEEGRIPTIQPVAWSAIFELLYEKRLHKHAGRLFSDVAEHAEGLVNRHRSLLRQQPEEAHYVFVANLAKNLGRLHAAALAASRTDEARRVGDMLIEELGEARGVTALVEAALEVRQVEAMHLEWLERASEHGVDLAVLNRKVEQLDADRSVSAPGAK